MHDRKLRAVWEDCFRPALTRPGFIRLVILLSGWVLTEGTHAVTAALVATDVARRRHWAAFHRFLSRGRWDVDALGEQIFLRILSAEAGVVRVVIDDTLAIKKGPKI